MVNHSKMQDLDFVLEMEMGRSRVLYLYVKNQKFK